MGLLKSVGSAEPRFVPHKKSRVTSLLSALTGARNRQISELGASKLAYLHQMSRMTTRPANKPDSTEELAVRLFDPFLTHPLTEHVSDFPDLDGDTTLADCFGILPDDRIGNVWSDPGKLVVHLPAQALHDLTPENRVTIKIPRHGASSPWRKTAPRISRCGISEARRLDQYYTDENLAKRLYAVFVQMYGADRFLMVEPSAGRGAFLKLMPAGSIGFDVDPQFKGIWRTDYLTAEIDSARQFAVIGNPPFGQKASLAIRFFNYSARFARVIAFILPLSACKASIENKFDSRFHLVYQEYLPENAFVFMSEPKSVPAVFQIWECRDIPRTLRQLAKKHPDFDFITSGLADFVITRNGGNAGKIHRDFTRSKLSNYFVRSVDRTVAGIIRVEHIMRMLDFASIATKAAGARSLAMGEIVELYSSFCERLAQGSD